MNNFAMTITSDKKPVNSKYPYHITMAYFVNISKEELLKVQALYEKTLMDIIESKQSTTLVYEIDYNILGPYDKRLRGRSVLIGGRLQNLINTFNSDLNKHHPNIYKKIDKRLLHCEVGKGNTDKKFDLGNFDLLKVNIRLLVTAQNV